MLEAYVERLERTERGALILAGLRLVLGVIALVSLWLMGQMTQPGPVHVTLVIVFVMTVLYAVALRKRPQAPQVAFLQLVVDVALESVLIYHTGGVRSPFIPLFLVSIAAGALVLSARAALFLACQATVMLSAVTISYTFGLGSAENNKIYATLTFFDHVSTHISSVASFFFVSLLAGTLSRRLAVIRVLHDQILEGIDEGILVLNSSLEVLYSNSEAARLLGTSERLGGRPIGEVLGPETEIACGQALASNCSTFQEMSVGGSDAGGRPIRCRMIPLLRAASPSEALILILADISAERQASEALAQNERLEAIAEISASLAHEIRNPLASIRGSVQEISKSAAELPEPRRELLDIVLSESDRLDGIISDFLSYARLRSASRRPVRIAEVLDDMVAMLRSRPEAAGVRIEPQCDRAMQGMADPEHLRQVLLNLGINALESMAATGGRERRLTLRAFRTAGGGGPPPPALSETRPDGPGVAIEVADTGQGMAEDVRRRAFDPFFTTKAHGTGLGLSLVARIVRAHGGTIGLASRVGEGTTVRITFPDAQPEPSGSRRLRPAAAAGPKAPAPRSPVAAGDGKASGNRARG